MMNPVAIRLLNQQLVAPQFDDPAEHRHHAHNNSGIFQPIIAHDGIVCGNWSPFKEDCQVAFFEGDYGVENVQEAWKVYKRAMMNS